MKPTRIEYDIGSTRHGQALRLVRTEQAGHSEWTLHRDAADQRDDEVFISGMTDYDILKMAEAVKHQRMQP